MKIEPAKQTTSFNRKIITYSTETLSSDKAASLQQEHVLIAKKEDKSNDNLKNDKKDPVVNLAVQLSSAGVVGGLTYAFVTIPVNTTQQEIAKKLIEVGAIPDQAQFAAKFLIEHISEPNIRNIIISVATGVGFFTLIYKLDWPLWLKTTLTILLVSGVFYLTFTYLPNRTPVKLDKPPATEKSK